MMLKDKLPVVLVANRGEIARRIIRSCKALGIRTVAVYSDADRMAQHVLDADTAIHIGASDAASSYLNSDAILHAARTSQATAVHPGYGFLSENADFARAVADAGLIFIGPTPDAIEAMGDKARAKAHLDGHAVPLIPGYHGTAQDDKTLSAAALDMGLPVMIKAAAGGGGRGMRVVKHPDGLPDALARARSEAVRHFGNDRLIIEKAITHARHIEVQVFGDKLGNIVHLFERDCTLQRRHQKIIEEAPAACLTPSQRAEICASAVNVARVIHYQGAGTVEFLFTPADGAHYFLEMNTRLQVEHPVTEAITGLDLVAWQLAVAAGLPLPCSQDEIKISGHAVEARIYCEDPKADFMPAAGPVHMLDFIASAPPAWRLDSAINIGQAGDVSSFYDPMIAKLIVHGDTAEATYRELEKALAHLHLDGPAHNIGFLHQLIGTYSPGSDDSIHTNWLEEIYLANDLPDKPISTPLMAVAAFLAELPIDTHGAPHRWSADPNTRYGRRYIGQDGTVLTADFQPKTEKTWALTLDGTQHNITLVTKQDNTATILFDGTEYDLYFVRKGNRIAIGINGRYQQIMLPTVGGQAIGQSAVPGDIRAPMHGLVIGVDIQVGDRVQAGDRLTVLEAMKMQHSLSADISGIITALNTAAGAQVSRDDLLIRISPATETDGN